MPSDIDIQELKRLHSQIANIKLGGIGGRIVNAFPSLIARLEAAEAAMQSLHNLRTTHVRTADGKLACVEVSKPETHPGTFCMWKFKDFDLDSELADAEPGESITLTYRELTEDEFKDLGDFDGW